jgi:hypothetical protein
MLHAGGRAPVSLSSEDGATERLCVPLPPFAVRAGARREIVFEPKKASRSTPKRVHAP